MDEQEDALESGAPAAAEAKAGGKKKKIIIAAVGALLLAGGGYGGMTMFGGTSAEAPAEMAYVEIPAMLINIRSADGKARFLKVRLVLETTPEAKEAIEPKIPAVIDAMQNFLREIRPEDLGGASAMFRLKEELLVRADRSVGSDQITDVLIQELVQQ